MNIDTIRGLSAYLVAALVVLIGLVALIWLTASKTIDPTIGVPLIASIIAGAAGFLFGSESTKQGAKQAERNILQTPGGTGTTVTGDNPTVTTTATAAKGT